MKDPSDTSRHSPALEENPASSRTQQDLPENLEELLDQYQDGERVFWWFDPDWGRVAGVFLCSNYRKKQCDWDLCLENAVLVDAEFTGSWFNGMVFRSVDLSRSNLAQTELRDVHFHDCQLAHANLTEAELYRAHFYNTDLSTARLTRARFDDKTIWPKGFDWQNSGAVGPGANLTGVDLRGLDLSRADLTNARLEGSCLDRVLFDKNTLWPEDFDWRNSGAVGPDANLTGADLSGMDLSSRDLSGANLTRANLNQTQLTLADLRGTNLSGVDLSQVSLHDTVYDDNTVWPEGFDFRTSGSFGPGANFAGKKAGGHFASPEPTSEA